MHGVLSQLRAVFFEFQPLGTARFFLNAIVSITGLSAFQPNVLAGHHITLRITIQPRTGLRRLHTSKKTGDPPRPNWPDGTPAEIQVNSLLLGENLRNNA